MSGTAVAGGSLLGVVCRWLARSQARQKRLEAGGLLAPGSFERSDNQDYLKFRINVVCRQPTMLASNAQLLSLPLSLPTAYDLDHRNVAPSGSVVYNARVGA